MYLEQYETVRRLSLEMLEDESDPDGTILLEDVVAAAQDRVGDSELFPKERLTNYVRFTKTDMEARCEVERIPRSSSQRISLWRADPDGG